MTARDDIRRIGLLAGRQRGLVRHRQLVELGLRPHVIDRLVEDRWLHPIHRRVYAVGHAGLDQEARWLAATMAIDEAVLSHRAGGALWAVLPARRRIDITVPRLTGYVARDHVVPHRRRLAEREWTVRRGIRVTTLTRTLIDIAASEPPAVLADAFEEAQVRHRLRPEVLAEELVIRAGQRGTGRLRALLADAVDPGLVQSRLELRFLRFCRDVGLPRPETQVWIAGWPVDFLFADVGLVVETDGWRFHASAAKRRRDARKTADVEAAGHPVLRLGWDEIVHRPTDAQHRVHAVRRALTVA